MTEMNEHETYAAYWPGGPTAVECAPPAPRPDSLNGKTIAFLWDNMFRGDEIFPVIQKTIAERFSETRFVGYEAFGSTFGGEEHAVLANLPEKLKQHRIDAVISGIGC
jgi:hypothetical protein